MASSKLSLAALEEKIINLEKRNDTNTQLIANLERENKAHKRRIEVLENIQERANRILAVKEACVFSARLTSNDNLDQAQPAWKSINNCVKIYKASPHFDALACRFTAPINGDYFMDLGLRQEFDTPGVLEVMLMVGTGDEENHAYIGSTGGKGQVCHKTMTVTLHEGNTVRAVVRRVTGKAAILWCAFHGHLISDHA